MATVVVVVGGAVDDLVGRTVTVVVGGDVVGVAWSLMLVVPPGAALGLEVCPEWSPKTKAPATTPSTTTTPTNTATLRDIGVGFQHQTIRIARGVSADGEITEAASIDVPDQA